MVGMNKKKERSQNAVNVKNRLFCTWGVLTRAQSAQIFIFENFISWEICINEFKSILIKEFCPIILTGEIKWLWY